MFTMPFKTGNWGEQAKSRSTRRKEYFRKYQKQRYAQKKVALMINMRKWRLQNPEKAKAEWQATYIIEIPKNQLCEECNTILATQRHHPDYSKPLEVEFLCASCHRKKCKKR